MIVKDFKKIGQFWTWKEGAEDVYNGHDAPDDGLTVTLYGSCRPEDVDWATVLAANSGDLAEEKEITIKNRSFVKVIGFRVWDGGNHGYKHHDGKFVKLETPLIVPAA